MNRQILLVGIGQLGCAVADSFAESLRREDGQVHVLALDTDAATADSIVSAPYLSLAYPCKIADVLDTFDTDLLKEWFPCDRENDCVEYFEMLSMNEGSNQWRMKALLSFYYFLSKPKNQAHLTKVLEPFFTACANADPSQSIEIFFTASLAGGTGSGLLLPLSLYIKRLCKERGIATVHCRSLLALPDVCEELMTPEQQVKARANAYATLRELNTVTQNALEVIAPVSFRIGCEEDTVFGLLYDAELPEFRNKDALPFEQIYLYRRLPGIHSLSYQVAFLSDCIRSLFHEELPPPPESDAIFAGISLTKTIYPINDLVTYLAKRRLCEITDKEYLPFYQRASHNYKILSGTVSHNEDEERSEHSLMAQAVNTTVTETREKDESYAILLARQYTDSSFDHSPTEILPEAYLPSLLSAIAGIFTSDSSDDIEAIVKANAPSQNKNKKKRQEPLLGRTERRKSLIRLASNCRIHLENYYEFGQTKAKDIQDYTTLLTDPTSPHSLDSVLLTVDGKPLHPVFALCRLSALYRALERTVESRRTQIKKEQLLLTPDMIPDWILMANAEVHMPCRYDSAHTKRFIELFEGKTAHVGGKNADRHLFSYDLEVSYMRMREAYQALLIEALLPIIGNRIESYFRQFKAFALAEEDQLLLLDAALHRSSGRLGTVYHVGATPEEKKTLYDRYCEDDKDTESYYSLLEELDIRLGEAFLSSTNCSLLPEETAEKTAEALMHSLTEEIRSHCLASSFFAKHIAKNVLDILLHQNGRNGADPADLALSKAFSAGIEPLIYTIPESKDAYRVTRRIKRSVTAYLPAEAEAYLMAHADQYQGRAPHAIMDDILFRAGEYESQVAFSRSLPLTEIRILRKTTGLTPALLEVASEYSDMPLYYKAYRKALSMKAEQCTALWDPYLSCSISDGLLPLIAH
ncbi:MAG: hypothetical protein E7618_04260 [Ruminococcaceae bacterium]|nr:hypothetical protein [Oscillospiraceae bacterium]